MRHTIHITYSKLYAISQKKSDQDLENVDIIINITKDKNPTSKNSAGKVLGYK